MSKNKHSLIVSAMVLVVMASIGLAMPSPLSNCVSQAIIHTQMTYPSDTEISVWTAGQVTDAELAKLAPSVAGTDFGKTMNLVILKGHFKALRSSGYVNYILYILTPFPNCYPTLTTFNVRDFGLLK